jgi:hypothetical protein
MSEVGFSAVQPSGALNRNSPAASWTDGDELSGACAAVLFDATDAEFLEQPKETSARANNEMIILSMIVDLTV